MAHRVLIVDDSPLYRLRLAQIVSTSDQLQLVGLASDGREAIRLIEERQPDLVVLDLEMPEIGGISVLRWAMKNNPVPVVICSGLATSQIVFQALDLGAVDFVTKPELRYAMRSEQFATNLRFRLEAAAQARVQREAKRASGSIIAATELARKHSTSVGLVGIIGSAGGPTAVARLIRALPSSCTFPIIIALHMPAGFTRSFAERLTRTGRLEAREARNGDRLLPSRIYVAPGGWQTSVSADQQGALSLRVRPALDEDAFAPSADLLLTSMAQTCGSKSVCVVLTGMGEDGLRGAQAIRDSGGMVLVESRESALVWGMPRAVAEAGLASAELDLSSIATALSLLCD
ncbi:MAG: chemotaxis response regulator protein-glutamate methylesterase [Pyrinomonas sp.]|uniref:chemotaxis-specific protein-glutamate methyltransferase CheB n=1 Tax=Pyrinomonas sp. TaxID=2080306 RepID=UPI003317120B